MTMDEQQRHRLAEYDMEVQALVGEVNVDIEGEHLWTNYQQVTAIIIRMQEMHNEISLMEIYGEDWPEIKKFRTLVIDPTIERLERVAAYESRKITAKQMEKDLDR